MTESFDAVDVITTKRDRHELSDDQIRWVIDAYTRGVVADEQMSSLAMAVLLNGMTRREIATWTAAMIASGERMDFSGLSRPTADKHSTGGVGDKITLPLAPLVAVFGVAVPQLSGRGLGHTGGTLDKLESVAGWQAALSNEAMMRQLEDVGAVICAAGSGLAPADKKLYALRDVTGTVEAIPLIASSIMSKKIAEGTGALVLDVKVGSGAFMKTLPDARELAKTMVKIGKQAGRKVAAVLSNMDEPLGRMIGNALEVKEAIDTLRGKGPADLVELVKALAREALLMAPGSKLTQAEAGAKVAEVLASGAAFATFVEMVKMQGGDASMIEHPEKLPTAKKIVPLVSDRDGHVAAIECEEIGLAAMMLGAGRETKESKIDMAVGLELVKHVGDSVKQGEPLAQVHIDPDRDNAKALERLRAAFRLESKPVQPQSLILDIVS